MAIAWVFPGQGSQKVGMAEALLSIDGSRERFAMASELLGRDLLAICQGDKGGGEGPDDLNDTRNTQPALFVIESLLADNLHQQGREPLQIGGVHYHDDDVGLLIDNKIAGDDLFRGIGGEAVGAG